MKKLLTLFIIVFLLFNSNLIAQANKNKVYYTTNEEITITIGNDSIAAYAMLAAGKEKKETVILLHGRPGNERNLDLAQELRRNGRNVIYFNYRGAWGSQGEFLFSNLTKDVKHVLDFFSTPENSEKYRIQTDSFILFGHSMGGKVALLSGGQEKRVKKIAVYAPWNFGAGPVPTQEFMKQWYKNTIKPLFMLNTEIESFTKDYFLNRKSFDLKQYKNQLNSKKVLILDNHNGNKNWIEFIGNIDYQIMDTDHSFSDKRLELIEKVSEWLNN
jgi:pimeloyl-ACP methyl ester carboxylesterase